MTLSGAGELPPLHASISLASLSDEARCTAASTAARLAGRCCCVGRPAGVAVSPHSVDVDDEDDVVVDDEAVTMVAQLPAELPTLGDRRNRSLLAELERIMGVLFCGLTADTFSWATEFGRAISISYGAYDGDAGEAVAKAAGEAEVAGATVAGERCRCAAVSAAIGLKAVAFVLVVALVRLLLIWTSSGFFFGYGYEGFISV